VKPEKVREMSPAELEAEALKLQEQLFRLRVQKAIGQLDNPMKIRQARRSIALIKTVLKQKQAAARA
jgi:large subunit ribosomal protein L29